MAEDTVVLRGGVRDGDSTMVDHAVRRLITPSDAPGLVEVYEADGTLTELRGSGEARVFVHVGQEASDLPPEAQHAPSS